MGDETLCWKCKKATGGCSWSAGFVPVKGWDADRTLLYEKVESFHVRSCPEFERDEPHQSDDKRFQQYQLTEGSMVTPIEVAIAVGISEFGAWYRLQKSREREVVFRARKKTRRK